MLYEVITNVPLGSKSRVTLADSTVVFLNSGSELQYPSVFEDGNREVALIGEAFFKVKSVITSYSIHYTKLYEKL